MSAKKPCTCVSPGLPTNLPRPANKWKGTGICSKCGGEIKFPYGPETVKREIDLADIAETAMSKLMKNSQNLSVEVLTAYYLSKIANALEPKEVRDARDKKKSKADAEEAKILKDFEESEKIAKEYLKAELETGGVIKRIEKIIDRKLTDKEKESAKQRRADLKAANK